MSEVEVEIEAQEQQPARPAWQAVLIDLVIIIGITVIAFFALRLLQPRFNMLRPFPQVLSYAGGQFWLTGLGPLLVLIIRRERPADYGFVGANLLRSLGLGLIFSVVYAVVNSLLAGQVFWIPLWRLGTLQTSLRLATPYNLIGLLLTVLVWGVIGAFVWLAIAKKVGDLLPTPRLTPWLSPGPIAAALASAGLALARGQGVPLALGSLLTAYFITVTPRVTRNAWGGLLVQFLTTAMGR